MQRRTTTYAILVAILLLLAISTAAVLASDTPDPASVTIAGSFQSELGCPGDWQPECGITHLAFDADDGVWQGVFNLPAGSWFYKAALNDSWAENYGANAQRNGPDISLDLAAAGDVKFYYDHESHWVTDDVNSRIATAAGSFQSELGCPGDWQPWCLRSWLQDPDGDGVYTFTTTAIPAGPYETKAAIDEGWAESYPASNLAFNVPADGDRVTFRFTSATNDYQVVVEPQQPDPPDVQYFGLGHNSQDSLYRVPFGAITAGTELTIRFRTFHDDVTSVRARFWDTTANGQFFKELERVASDGSCYDAQLDQAGFTCDYWQATHTPGAPTTLYYRFIIEDRGVFAYYDDDYWRDGEWGEATPSLQDDGFVVTVYDPGFEAVEWMQDAVVYQIFPDRFRNGRSDNDASPQEARYGYPPELLDQIIVKDWDELPEGYCRGYVNPAEPCTEGPRGRDYFGGDLRGVQQRLNYLQDLGVTAIYFNPLFEAASNHAYDTQDYYSIDHFFGSNKEFQQFVKQAERSGIRVILDGVFNHVSSDSAYFDRYGHFDSVGACESVDSPYRSWFYFRPEAGGPCAGSDGPNTMTYDSWFGFDSLPVLNKNNPEVRDLVYGADEAVARFWLDEGAAGWRLDVMGDTSFPADFWIEFRDAVKATDPEAVIIGELWKKFEVLSKVQGDQADTAMNYRFRNAVLGFFGTVDDKGFVDDGQSDQPPSRFVRKLMSVREDYPDATYYTLLNIMDSHDTQRILWSLTPGEDNREDKEYDAANVERGKEMLRLATVVQMTMPGAPTIYYGDEVGVTGDDDPDDRRTFPWKGDGPYGSGGDSSLHAHYRLLTQLRHDYPLFREGEVSYLLADDQDRTLAYLVRTVDAVALVAVNRHPDEAQALVVDVDGLLPGDVSMFDALGAMPDVQATGSQLTIVLPALRAAVYLPEPGQDLVAPAAPTNLAAGAGNAQVELSWESVPGAAAYRVYRSPVTGGGYVLVAETNATSHVDLGLDNGKWAYYVVTAVDAAGNEGPWSNEASALPLLPIGWANLQYPATVSVTVGNTSEHVYGQVWIDGVTNQPGPTPGLLAQLGFGPEGSDPAGDPGWTWVDASFNVDAGNNDEFVAQLTPEAEGVFDYVYRYSTSNGLEWLVADLNGPVAAGSLPPNPGKLTVNPSPDTTPPAAPTNLVVAAFSPASISLAWDAHPNTDGDLAGFQVHRREAGGGADFALLATVAEPAATGYVDTDVVEGVPYEYYVLAYDTSFNKSDPSNMVTGTAQPRTVQVTFNVTVPGTTPAGSTVYIAGTLSRLNGSLPDWDPGAVSLTAVSGGLWTITLTGEEGTSIEYKYTLGSWDFVEKDASCEELNNRTLTLEYGSDGQQVVNDTVANWRNVSPCGN